ncbi:hypothetical protein GCM10027091_12630 [Streptomyces daliensis]
MRDGSRGTFYGDPEALDPGLARSPSPGPFLSQARRQGQGCPAGVLLRGEWIPAGHPAQAVLTVDMPGWDSPSGTYSY